MKAFVGLGLVVALAGCAKDDGGVPSGMKVREGRAPAVGRGAPAPTINALAPYERLVRGFEACGLEGNQIVSTCPALHAFETEMAGVSSDIQVKVGEQMIGHTSPAVRVQAAKMMKVNGRLAPRSLDALARVAQVERDPRVLEAFLRIAGKQGSTTPSATAMLLAAARHADAGVRLEAIEAIAAVENRGMAGGAHQLVALADTDPDLRVRRSACEQAGKLGTDEVLALYERATATAADPDLYAACMAGLAAMFHNHPSFDTASEAAYRLFLRRLEATPRSEHAPPWNVMSTFCYFSHEADLDKLAAWKRRATWFDAVEVKRVMALVVVDPHASWQARTGAIESLVGLGATTAELTHLKRGLTAPADKLVVDKLASVTE